MIDIARTQAYVAVIKLWYSNLYIFTNQEEARALAVLHAGFMETWTCYLGEIVHVLFLYID